MGSRTRRVYVRNLAVGDGAPISVQSMTNTKTEDVDATLRQIERLLQAGCQIVRLAVPSQAAAKAFAAIRRRIDAPLVADIHFNYELALAAIDAGADKIRINPGNIGGREKVRAVVERAVAAKVPIRVGVNSGSIEKDILKEEGGPTVRALVRSALRNIDLCREFGAEDLVLSLKSSDVVKTIAAYREASRHTDVPLHIGVTEAGTVRSGTIKSAVALGILLAEGIGDTLRVSLTGDPVEEVYVGYQILKALDLSRRGVNLISCPTCSRTQVDLIPIAEEVERRLAGIEEPLTVAVMGCVVNGPGEAKEADVGVACGKGSAVLFRKGVIIRKVAESEIVSALIAEVESLRQERAAAR
ncbi:MAG: flavodoxin-dependent (E)-4-hydroxy-3-methylbut-2-enyl-diphosphate synthase [candidate division KSB1 bacterium]|nr:flavodoxin-dependent (E)-4-hydroxy-3-methylbut-2-enyl-diphosphate synthase [candidate division KSB1 bacterium]